MEVNRERKRRIKVNEGIGMKDQDKHFRDLLEGEGGRQKEEGWRVLWSSGRKKEKDEKEDIKREKLREVIKKLNDGKGWGGDGILNKV